MDIQTDSNFRTWYAIGRQILSPSDIPGYVGEYTPPTAKMASALPDELFADQGKRAFPIYNPAATWLSAAYYAYGNSGLPVKSASDRFTGQVILRAADVWGIRADVDAAMSKIAAWFEKQAEGPGDDAYGWLIRDASGRVTERRYPLFDAECVKKAAAFFDENRRAYPWDIRAGIASAILTKAAAFGVDIDGLPGSVQREAGYGIPRKTVLMREINERVKLAECRDDEACVLLANVNRLISAASDSEFAAAVPKIAAVINHFDEAQGLTPLYGRQIMFPADIMAGVSVKEARDFSEHAVQLGGRVFDTAKLASLLPARLFSDTLGDQFFAKVAKEGVVDPALLKAGIAGLPASEKAALSDAILAACAG